MNRAPAPAGRGEPLELPALLVGVLPIVTVNVCLLLSIQAATIPACVPYIEGCTSVSAAGRNPPSIYLFRGVMLPVAAALVLFWYLNARWLDLLQGRDGGKRHAILWLGVIAAVFLGLYVSFLGSAGEFARMMRRYGIFVFFGFTALAQLLSGRDLLRIAGTLGDRRLARYARAILGLCLAMLVLGLTNVLAKAVMTDADAVENSIEWNFAILMQAYFLIIWRAWRKTGLSSRLRLEPPAGT